MTPTNEEIIEFLRDVRFYMECSGSVNPLETKRARLIYEQSKNLITRLSEPEKVETGEWRAWKEESSIITIDNGEKCFTRANDQWRKNISDKPDWYEQNGFVEITSTPEGRAAIQDLMRQIGGVK